MPRGAEPNTPAPPAAIGQCAAPAKATESEPGGEAPLDLEPLLGMVGVALRLAQIRVFSVFFSDFGDIGLRPGEITVLFAIGRNPRARQGVLANALAIKRSNMAKLVMALHRRRLVERHVPVSDKRAVELSLTTSGQALVADAFDKVLAHDDRVTRAALSTEERQTLIHLLRRLSQS